MMSEEYYKALARFAIVLPTVLGVAVLALSALLLSPELVLQIALYVLGGIGILFGIETLGCLVWALLSTMGNRS